MSSATRTRAGNRRRFNAIVDRRDGDAHDGSFRGWDRMVALVLARLGALDTLRGLEQGWRANRQHHYGLGGGPLARSSLAGSRPERSEAPESGPPDCGRRPQRSSKGPASLGFAGRRPGPLRGPRPLPRHKTLAEDQKFCYSE